jgi:F-type H+-transporting ATPase subunit gamma
MATLREIRKRITSIKSTQQITKAMKMVAAARLRKAQEAIIHIRPYAYNLRDLIGDLISRVGDLTGIPLIELRPVDKVLLVIVTADRGMCGAFNSNIIRDANRRIADSHGAELNLFLVGKKGMDYFKKRATPVIGQKINFFNHLGFEDALEISRGLIDHYTSGRYDRIEIIYNEFKSAVQQEVISEPFLPFTPAADMAASKSQVDFLYEPDKKVILNKVIPLDLNIQVWRILLESNAAEQGARMTAMENATDNAQDLIERLTVFYNRSRQGIITKEISEIVGGADALKAS